MVLGTQIWNCMVTNDVCNILINNDVRRVSVANYNQIVRKKLFKVKFMFEVEECSLQWMSTMRLEFPDNEFLTWEIHSLLQLP